MRKELCLNSLSNINSHTNIHNLSNPTYLYCTIFTFQCYCAISTYLFYVGIRVMSPLLTPIWKIWARFIFTVIINYCHEHVRLTWHYEIHIMYVLFQFEIWTSNATTKYCLIKLSIKFSPTLYRGTKHLVPDNNVITRMSI